jgi:hypothetical protein
MVQYRCFFLDRADHFRNVTEFWSGNDASALERARLYRDATRAIYAGIELWQGKRYLATERSS